MDRSGLSHKWVPTSPNGFQREGKGRRSQETKTEEDKERGREARDGRVEDRERVKERKGRRTFGPDWKFKEGPTYCRQGERRE